jgi:riboflavin biosynthesis pyrimidine reductase
VHGELAGDAWLIGRVTGQEFAKGKPYPVTTKETVPREQWFARRDAKAYGVVLDAHGKIAWGRSDIGGDPIVVVLSEAVPDSHLVGLRGEGLSYIFAGKSQLDLALTLDILNRELGVKRLLLEGGGGANGAFLRAGLVDELNLVICPAVDGTKGAPSVFDSTEAEAEQRPPVTAMTLESSQALEGGAMLLRYRIQNAGPHSVSRYARPMRGRGRLRVTNDRITISAQCPLVSRLQPNRCIAVTVGSGRLSTCQILLSIVPGQPKYGVDDRIGRRHE